MMQIMGILNYEVPERLISIFFFFLLANIASAIYLKGIGIFKMYSFGIWVRVMYVIQPNIMWGENYSSSSINLTLPTSTFCGLRLLLKL